MTTFADIQAQLAPNAVIRIDDDIVFPAMLQVPHEKVRFVGTGRIFCMPGVSDAFHISGADVRMDDFTIWNEHGAGIRVDGGSKFRAYDLQINTLGDGLIFENGAGAWVRGVHLNGLGTQNNRAIRFGQWDTAFIDSVLVEEHGCGMRFGWGGHTANIQISTLTVDRARVGMQIEAFGGRIDNIQISNLWTAGRTGGGAICPLLVDATSGPINTVRIDQLFATGFASQTLTNGTVGGAGLSVGWQHHQ